MEPGPINPTEEEQEEQIFGRHMPLTTVVAVTIALLATFMGISGVKSTNIRQAMQSNMTDRVEMMLENQARATRADVANATADRFRLEAKNLPPGTRATFLQRAGSYQDIARAEAGAKADAKHRIHNGKVQYSRWQEQQEGFDLSEAALAISIALLAITALVQHWWLYVIAVFPSAFGIVMGLAGFLNWGIQLEQLVRFLEA